MIAVVGTGPAGLLAAYELAMRGRKVTLFEKRKGAGRKLLVAGSSGLNITYDAPLKEFAAFYRDDGGRMPALLEAFSPADWRAFIESTLGLETFVGASRRLFVREMKASGLLKSWLAKLETLGVSLETGQEPTDFAVSDKGVQLTFDAGKPRDFDAAIFALGGVSWESPDAPPLWPELFTRKGLALVPFAPSNVGFEIAWPEKLGREVDGKPLKNVTLTTKLGARRGDLMLKAYGIEGTPVYHVGVAGTAHLDFKPDLTEAECMAKLRDVKENLSPFRRLKHKLKLGDTALSLIKQLTPESELSDLSSLGHRVKNFPLELAAPRPLEESISSSGGLAWSELDETLMLKKYPRIFAAGEMIAWDAPTGGFLIQACVSQGFAAAQGALASS